MAYGKPHCYKVQIDELEKENAELQARVAAPEDSGIEELDALCAMYNRKEIDITDLVCRIWNNQQARVAELETIVNHPVIRKVALAGGLISWAEADRLQEDSSDD